MVPMIYDFTLAARRVGFDLSKSVTRRKLEDFAELVIRDLCEQLPEDKRQEIYQRYHLRDRDYL